MVADGRLITMQPGVFRSAQWPASTLATMRAACARNPLGYVGFTAACSEWGLRRIPDLGVHMLVPHGSSPTLHGVTVHRCRTIDDVDRVDRPDGIRLTSPPRSLFDSADLLGLSAARSVTEQLIHEGMSTIGTIVDTYTRLRHASRPGSRTMLLVLASRPMWCKALHSNLESKVLEEIERQALPAPQRQCPITLADGTVIHADFGWPEWKVGLEVDDPAWHAGSQERHRDAGRDRRAAAVGWVVVRVTDTDVSNGLHGPISDVAQTIALRRASVQGGGGQPAGRGTVRGWTRTRSLRSCSTRWWGRSSRCRWRTGGRTQWGWCRAPG